MRAFLLEPLPNSTSAAPGATSLAISAACLRKMPISDRVG
jgi:hypothetical protein